MSSRDSTKRVYVKTSVNLNLDLYKRIEEYRIANQLPDKTTVIDRALNYYLSAAKCRYCGTLNPPNGVNCAVCGNALKASVYDWVITELSGMARACPEEFGEMFKLIEPKFNELMVEHQDKIDAELGRRSFRIPDAEED